ncbi:membrane protein [Acidocella aquatica]|uniref:Membrane protein n=1 Tax=Acidocella aquatica TaxID=1922313 RepID=A0ABQ6A1C4_9PROT|nr:DUF2244 domain-containing protein [Acidocella aquatica]GLR65606.1 membrane protein [Acidocella aquatica]
MDAETASAGSKNLIFEAVIKPHRSLSYRAMFMVMGGMIAVSLFMTSEMAHLGAWPVIGFNIAGMFLAVSLFWLNMRAARASETISLRDDQLAVTRMDVHGRSTSFSVPPDWLNVVLEERPGTVPKLLFSSRGKSFEVARALGEAQKRELAEALSRAMHRWRNPLFDNPQLR